MEPITHTQNIVEAALSFGTFNTLADLCNTAGLANAMKSTGPLTVFAPTDEAFAKLPDVMVNNLLRPENRQDLIDILMYHVVSGELRSRDVAAMTTLTTLEGSDLAINVEAGCVMVNNATVSTPDIICSNGIIHAIDTVMTPPRSEE